MTERDEQLLRLSEIELNNFSHPAWDEPIVCRVEVDLPAWLSQLAGGNHWEIFTEAEDENCISFTLRESSGRENVAKKTPKMTPKMAEVTLYHNGYAVVDVEGEALFDGTLTSGTNNCAHLSYFHAESGEPIILN